MSKFPFNRLQKRYRRFRVSEVLENNPKILHLLDPDVYNDIYAQDGESLSFKTTDNKASSKVTADDIHYTKTNHANIKYYKVELRNQWTDTIINKGDYVNIVGSFDKNGECIIDGGMSSDNRIIVNPDNLLSATTISDANKCLRIAFFKEKYAPEYGGPNEAALIGTLTHEILQAALREYFINKNESSFSRMYLKMFAKQSIHNHALSIVGLGVESSNIFAKVEQYFNGFQKFKDAFITLNERIEWKKQMFRVKLTDFHATEETVWSPMNGLKGNIDFTGQFNLTNDISPNRANWKNKGKQGMTEFKPQEDQGILIPVELKSGQQFAVVHDAQIILYLEMMRDKYDKSFDKGILYYFNKPDSKGKKQYNSEIESKSYGTVIGMTREPHLLRDLLRARNRVANSIMNAAAFEYNRHKAQISNENYNLEQDKSISDNQYQSNVSDSNGIVDIEDLIPKPPPMRKDENECRRCFQKDICFLYHSAVEKGDAETAGLPQQLFDPVIPFNLSLSHNQYLEKWLKLIDLESLEMDHFRKEIWTMDGPEREKLGRCASCMIIQNSGEDMVYRFIKHPKANQCDLEQLHMSIDDYVIISSEEGHLCISSGIIEHMDSKVITIKAKKPVRIPRLSHQLSSSTSTSSAPEEITLDLYRIDVDEYGGRMNQQRGFLMSLFSAAPLGTNDFGEENHFKTVLAHKRSIKLIVDLEPPLFTPLEECSDAQIVKNQCRWFHSVLNNDQQEVILNVLCAQDYSLILGMPGTGKTTIIAYLLKILTEVLGKTVLLTSYTHTAVDNLLLKCIELGLGYNIIRLGSASKSHHKIHKYMLSGLIPNFDYSDGDVNKIDEIVFKPLKAAIAKRKIIACTCLGVGDLFKLGPDFNKELIDYCIVDEAGQITQCATVGAIMRCKKFVLVGDHKQLEPLVLNHEAKKRGMNKSLLEVLCEEQESNNIDNICYLRHQYRMNRDVLSLSNEIIYNNRLLCGSVSVENAKFDLPKLHSIDKEQSEPLKWIYNVLDSNRSVVFVDTDPYGVESYAGLKTINEFEQVFICNLVEFMIKSLGASASDIGIMSPYNIQVSRLRFSLNEKLGIEESKKIDIHTIDKFQGKDKSCIIMSLIRSNDGQNKNDLVTDTKRINVAMTRAKTKLIMVGSCKAHIEKKHIGDYVRLMQKNNWIVSIEKQLAHSIKKICASSTQFPLFEMQDELTREHQVDNLNLL